MFGAFIGEVCTRILTWIVNNIVRFNPDPNLLTLIGLFINIFAAVLYAFGEFFYAGLVMIFANVFDMLDGRVARLTGRVTNAAGTAVSNATVKLKTGTSELQQTTTDAEGRFTFDNLPQGSYQVDVEAAGVSQTAKEPLAISSSGVTNVELADLKSRVQRNLTAKENPLPEPASAMPACLRMKASMAAVAENFCNK